MINRKLTIQSGLDAVGEPITAFQVEIDATHPITLARKKLTDTIIKTLEDDDLAEVVNLNIGIILTSFIDKNGKEKFYAHNEHPLAKSVDLGDAFRTYFYDILIKNVYDLLNDDGSFKVFFSIEDSITEALINAIEHGTDYCTKGEVSVQCIRGKAKALISISQTTSGPPTEVLDDFINNPRNYDAGKGYRRGCGIAGLATDKNVQFNYCSSDTDGFTVLLLTDVSDYYEIN